MCVCVWKLKHESVHAFQNLPGINIQLHAAGSVEGQQSTFSRKLAGEQSGLRVSPGKQINCVHTRRTLSVCHHLQAGIFPPERSSQTCIPLRAPFHLNSFPSPGENRPSNFVNVTLPNKCLLVFSYLFIFHILTAFHSPAAVVPMTCCPSCPSWLCSASVPSWCLNVLLWKSSFMKGESSQQEKIIFHSFFFFFLSQCSGGLSPPLHWVQLWRVLSMSDMMQQWKRVWSRAPWCIHIPEFYSKTNLY